MDFIEILYILSGQYFRFILNLSVFTLKRQDPIVLRIVLNQFENFEDFDEARILFLGIYIIGLFIPIVGW